MPKGVPKFQNYDTIETSKKLKLFSDFYLPIEIHQKTYQEYEEQEITYSIEEAKELGIAQADESLKEQIEGKQVTNKKINAEQIGANIEVEVIYEVLESIGTKRKNSILKGTDAMEERSLRIYQEKTFFSKISNTITKILTPTKIGINGMLISIKRNNALKAYEAYKASEDIQNQEKQEAIEKKFEDVYALYLESIDKYIMDSIYKKVKNDVASDFEKKCII